MTIGETIPPIMMNFLYTYGAIAGFATLMNIADALSIYGCSESDAWTNQGLILAWPVWLVIKLIKGMFVGIKATIVS